ncbi:MAG: hypothetical protein JRE24_05265 [Deltaproteobacteria bacterium]|nr:hypothetical protein [Deltaproteobacteria bacterium]
MPGTLGSGAQLKHVVRARITNTRRYEFTLRGFFNIVFFFVQKEKESTSFRLFLKILSKLVVTGSGETGLELSIPQLAVKDVARTNRKGFRVKVFLAIVREAEDKVVLFSMRGARHEVCSDDDMRCVLNIQMAHLVFKRETCKKGQEARGQE